MDIVLKRQVEILRTAHPDWHEDRLMRVARVWARRARRICWDTIIGEQTNADGAQRHGGFCGG